MSDMVLENPLIVTAANIRVCQTDKAGENFFFVIHTRKIMAARHVASSPLPSAQARPKKV